MLYCTKCKTLAADSMRTCPNCRRSRGLRPVRDEDEVFFMKVSETEAVELEELFEEQAIRHRAELVKAGLAAGVYDPEYMPTDRNLYVAYGDLERANAAVAAEAELTAHPEAAGEEDEMPQGKRLAIQTVSVLAFLLLIVLVVLGTDALAEFLRGLFTR